MGSQWYYAHNAETHGPVSEARLIELAGSGQVRGGDLVWREGMEQWAPSATVPGLLPVPPVKKGPPPLPVVVRAEPQALPFPSAVPVEPGTSPLVPVVAVIEPELSLSPRPARVVQPQAPRVVPPPVPATPLNYETGPIVPHQPKEFKDLYDQLLKFSIPVAVVGLVGEAIPGINIFAFLCALVLFLVLSSMFLYKAWDLIQDGRARTTPGKAVGFRFIPFYGFYWEFVAVKGLVQDITAYARARRIAVGRISETMAVWCCVFNILAGVLGFVPILGGLLFIPWVVLFLMLMNSVKSACIAIAAWKYPGTISALGSPPAAAAGVLGAVGVVEVVSEGFRVMEKVAGSSAE